VQLSPLERYTPLAAQFGACKEAFRGMAQTELREFLLFVFHGTEFRLFSLPLRIRNVILGVPSIFVPRNGILSCFLFRGRVQNGILRVFCSAEQQEFRWKYPFVLDILSSNYLFFCRKFPTLVLSPPDILLKSRGLFSEWLLILY
jgi:hypothetical protein